MITGGLQASVVNTLLLLAINRGLAAVHIQHCPSREIEDRAGTKRGRSATYEIGRIQSTDLVVSLAEDPNRKLRIRCVVKPDQAQAPLLDRLAFRPPERRRPPPSIIEMDCQPRELSARKT